MLLETGGSPVFSQTEVATEAPPPESPPVGEAARRDAIHAAVRARPLDASERLQAARGPTGE